jgi:predicted nucleic acid-binding protein
MALVVDASAIAEWLLQTPVGRRISDILAQHQGGLHIPHLAITEVVSIMRGLVLGGGLTESRAVTALKAMGELPAKRWPTEFLTASVWELRHNLTAYDATYVALAAALDTRVLTCDAHMAKAAPARCLVPPTD